ncbi:hypothetical protein KEF85_09975 [Methylomonas paludis]|uniref:Uncharacterized protein n=1 Tax=Methylomonas paludis TaxID=1173101 RepID=A0A975MKR4_9GAMM|nr:hypothetical protein [Methylomonas paludis]QWF69703.1 hypothetical protein KEF85_09975 [Methylomonas paludis]
MLDEVINYYLQSAETLAVTAFPENTVTPVTPAINSVLPLQAAAAQAVIPVTPEKRVTQTKSKNELLASDKAKLLSYLDAIGETDQEMINDFLDECAGNPEILIYSLQLAEDTLRVRRGDTAGLVRCMGCKHLTVDTCNLFGWRIVLDKWRRCADFDQNRDGPII